MRLFGRIYCLLSFCGFAATGVFAQIGSVSYEQRVDSLLHKMTLEEKVAQIYSTKKSLTNQNWRICWQCLLVDL